MTIYVNGSGSITGVTTAVTSTGAVNLDQLNAVASGYAARIAIIGDSLTDQNAGRTTLWTQILADTIAQTDSEVAIGNFAVGGYTAYTALNTVEFGSTTMVQKAIAYNPDYVLIMLGGNDALGLRTLAQIKQDIGDVCAAIKAGVPTAKIIAIQEQLHDSTNFTSSTLKNKGTVPFLFTLPLTGIKANAYSSSMLEDAASPDIKLIISRLVDFNAHMAGLVTVDETFVYNHWKVLRLGCGMFDGIHTNAIGQQFQAAQIMSGLAAISDFATTFPVFADTISNTTDTLNNLFGVVLTASGDGYVTAAPTTGSMTIAYELSVVKKIQPESWFYPYKTRYTIQAASNPNANIYLLVEGGPPNEIIYQSVGGAAFTTSTTTTSDRGNAIATLPNSFAAADGLVKVGNEVFGPFTLSDTATVVLSTTGNIEMGRNMPAQSTTIKMHSSGNAIDYDVQLAATGGTTLGTGTLTVTAATVALPAITVQGHSLANTTSGIGSWLNINGVLGVVPGLGIAPTTDNTYSCGGSGYRFTAVYATNGTIQTSDKRAKRDIGESLGVDFIKKLKPVSYRWNEDADMSNKKQGFIVQDILEVEPKFAGVVKGDTPDDLMGLQYTELLAPIVSTLQQVLSRLDALEQSK